MCKFQSILLIIIRLSLLVLKGHILYQLFIDRDLKILIILQLVEMIGCKALCEPLLAQVLKQFFIINLSVEILKHYVFYHLFTCIDFKAVYLY